MSEVAENIKKAYMVPGLPHLVFRNESWSSLQTAYQEVGKTIQSLNPDIIVVYSAQWISVLGHSFQADPNPKGHHVDENWYSLSKQATFDFDFKVDVDLAQKAASIADRMGLATKLVNYKGFPIDTGSLTVQRFLNPDNKIPMMIVSSNIYCDRDASRQLGQAVREALVESGKSAVLVNCSSLSHRFFTQDINPAEDKISQPEDDAWNQRILTLIKAGKNQEAFDLGPEYAQAANPEMQFKGFYWMMGALDMPAAPGNVTAYGPIWGTGNAVIEYSLN
ncbi:MAG: hypothetical protein KTR14_08830 [Vampirovibrio sp.]|nr:hypothetical protein [Vampirovibrio sp.]